MYLLFKVATAFRFPGSFNMTWCKVYNINTMCCYKYFKGDMMYAC